MLLNDCITKVKGIGSKRAELFNKLGIFSVADLLRFYPRQNAYIFLEQFVKLANLELGKKNISIVEVVSIQKKQSRYRLKYATLVVKDETGYAEVLLFATQIYRATQLKPGDKVLIIATASNKQGKILLNDAIIKNILDTQLQPGIFPTYSLVSGLSQTIIQKTISTVLKNYSSCVQESLPETILRKFALPDIHTSLNNIHFPANKKMLFNAQKRLIFEELFYIQFAFYNQQKQTNNRQVLSVQDSKLTNILLNKLPFKLTQDQQESWQAIKADLKSGKVMRRLLQGDVGSGKTIIALLTAVLNTQSSGQTVILAPTEVLALQHFNYFRELLAPFNINIELLVGNTKPNKRRQILSDLQNAQIDILIGTHAIFQPDVEFANLSLAIIDEQHRFGVQQRQCLFDKSHNAVHLLSMSATPIPRTLALALYGNLEISTIKTMPANRKPIKTLLYNEQMRHSVYQGAARQVSAGRQVYVVCPLIEESENATHNKNANDVYEELTTKYFSKNDCALLHGRMSSTEKEAIMLGFVNGTIKVLVSTTVIEVGINVPNACLIIIEGAEMFGLAQLHQLRGRVGRGEHQSYCALLINSNSNTDNSMQRLGLMVKYNDGFILAEQDLLLRGAGQLLGMQQHGFDDLLLANIIRDSDLLIAINNYLKQLEQETAFIKEISKLQQNSLINYKLASSLN